MKLSRAQLEAKEKKDRARAEGSEGPGTQSLYLLYWYKSTNTEWKTRDIRAHYALGTRADAC